MSSKKLRATKRDRMPVFLSQAEMTTETGMPADWIRQAKKNGCDAFLSGHRIASGILLRWFFEQQVQAVGDELPEGMGTWREVLNKMQAKREELKLERERGETMATADAQEQAARAMDYVFRELEAMKQRLAPELVGENEIGIARRLNLEIESFRERAGKFFEAVGK